MPATASTDFAFSPKVWKEHVAAYFRTKLVYGAIANSDDSLTQEPGTTVNFPYFKQIGAVEEPAENEALSVDNLSDDSFTATVKEVGKAVGVKKKAFKVSAARTERIIQEVTAQIGRRHAEKVDADLLAEYTTGGNFVVATMSIAGKSMRSIFQGKVSAFGDLHSDAVALHIHSLDLAAVMNDTTSGFMQANALDPMYRVPGFSGRLSGMAVFEVDSQTQGVCYIHKMDPYGYILKQDMEMESDYDLLNREWIFTGNQWYAVKSFHAKIASNDYKTAQLTFT